MGEKSSAKRVSRRQFGVLLAASSAALPSLMAQQTPQQAAPQQNSTRPAPGVFRRPMVPDTPPFEDSLEFSRSNVAMRAEPFPMSQVRLLPKGEYSDMLELNRGYMSRLDAD